MVSSATAQLSKLAELRAKTDQQLVSLIDNALEVGLLLAANELDADPEGVLHRRAEDTYGDTVMLVEKVENGREQRRLEEKLRQLRKSLEQWQARLKTAGSSAWRGQRSRFLKLRLMGQDSPAPQT
jgi:hypothetical protein